MVDYYLKKTIVRINARCRDVHVKKGQFGKTNIFSGRVNFEKQHRIVLNPTNF